MSGWVLTLPQPGLYLVRVEAGRIVWVETYDIVGALASTVATRNLEPALVALRQQTRQA